MEDLKLSTSALGVAVTGSRDYIRNHKRDPNSSYRVDNLASLAKFLLCDFEWLRTGREDLKPKKPTPLEVRAARAAVQNRKTADLPLAADNTGRAVSVQTINLPRREQSLPILGTAAASLSGAFQIDGTKGHAKRPSRLEGNANAYALYVVGVSMEPKYEPGELIVVNPDIPPRAGDYVVIQTQDNPSASISAWVKKLVKETETSYICRQLNPPATIEFMKTNVLHVHKIMSNNDLFS